jgi:hypothetical protein
MVMKRTALQAHLETKVFNRFPTPALPPQHYQAVVDRILSRIE